MKLAGLPGQLPTVPVGATWFRAVPKRFRHNPLGFVHTLNVPSRYSAGNGQYPLLYLACDRLTALLEYRALVRIPGLPTILPTSLASSASVFPVTVQLNHVIDLGDPSVRSQTVQALTGDWREYPWRPPSGPIPEVRSQSSTAPTQGLGAHLNNLATGPQSSALKWEAFLAPSAVRPRFCNLIVFPSRVNISYNPLQIASIPESA